MKLALYAEAVVAEQQGNFSVATDLYRRSFRLDAHVDRAYQRSLLVAESKALSHQRVIMTNDAEPPPSVTRGLPLAGPGVATAPLTSTINSFPDGPYEFLPEDPEQSIAIKLVPDELLLSVLYVLATRKDVTSLERFALVCRKARLVTLDSTIWR